MEYIDTLQSWLFFFSEGMGGLNLALLLIFLAAGPFSFVMMKFLYRYFEPIDGTVIRKDARKREPLLEKFGLKIPSAAFLGNSEMAPADGKAWSVTVQTDKGKAKRIHVSREIWERCSINDRIKKPVGKRYAAIKNLGTVAEQERTIGLDGKGLRLRHVAASSCRNLFVAFAVIALTIGAAGLWSKTAWIFSITPNTWYTMPFEAERGTTYLVRIEAPDAGEANVLLSSLDGSGGVVSRRIWLSGSLAGLGNPWDTVVFRMTQNAQPKMKIETRATRLFQAVLVRRPVAVLGYLATCFFFFLAAAYVHERRSRFPLTSNEATGIARAAERGVLAAFFTISFVAIVCAVWYLGIKALDKLFHFGIWTTYDHFIQDFFRGLIK